MAGVVYLNRSTLEDGLNWILTMAAELLVLDWEGICSNQKNV